MDGILRVSLLAVAHIWELYFVPPIYNAETEGEFSDAPYWKLEQLWVHC
jgi:hypothetical protein